MPTLELTKLEQSIPVDQIKDLIWSSVKVSEFDMKFLWVWQETPEEGERVHQPKRYVYNKDDIYIYIYISI